ncbi:MAG: response regulator [Lachnospiraceae bacterium]|nr:response regulator [Lachnospiraceae bacterium]
MDNSKDELFTSSHLLMLLAYTVFSIILVAEIFIMHWEKWVAFRIFGGVILAWYIYFSKVGSGHLRLWICSLLMMVTYFYYGTHDTSFFDLAVVICIVMFLYTLTGISSLVTLSQCTYYFTMLYAVISFLLSGETFTPLVISRLVLHVAIVTADALLARTIIKKWQAILGKSREEIEKLNESTGRLNDFIANVSHEIRTPINTIQGICSMEIGEETDPEKKEKLVSIMEAGKRIGEQITNVLDFSEIDRNDVANNYEDYMLSSVFNDIVSELEPHRKKNIELVINIDPTLPSVMNTDVGKLKKILWHLLINGIKFTNEGGVYVHVSSVPHEYGINLLIEVKDTGIGMDEAQLEQMYEGFYKADSGRDRSTGGLGLGMMIVHGFTKALGGFLIVESNPGEGTCVKVSIPNRVVDPSACMSVKDRESISLGAFLHFEKYPNPHVREFYDAMVKNMVTGLKVTMHRVDNLDALRALTVNKTLTHLFVGPEEYNSAVDYIEHLAQNVLVTVVANPEELRRPKSSKVRVMPKPFYCFPVVSILNSKPGDVIDDDEEISFPGVRVLVVDDEPMNLIVSSGMLRRYGMYVSTCESGQEAIEYCRQNEYDVIFMDHMMPVMDGVEAMKRIRSDQTRIKSVTPIIAFTANSVSSAREMFKRSGFDGFLAKPVDKIELERVLKHVLPPALIVKGKAKPSKKIEEQTGLHEQVDIEKSIPSCNRGDDLFERLKSVDVDILAGMHYCQDEPEFYGTILEQYHKESAGKKTRIRAALEDGILEDYATQVHAIKSSSKMIGANRLSEAAKKQEEAAKRGDMEAVLASHKEMMALYESVLQAIKPKEETGSATAVKDEAVNIPDKDETAAESASYGEVFEFEPEGGNE